MKIIWRSRSRSPLSPSTLLLLSSYIQHVIHISELKIISILSQY